MRHGIKQIETDANTIAAYSSREILYAYLLVKIIYELISQIVTNMPSIPCSNQMLD